MHFHRTSQPRRRVFSTLSRRSRARLGLVTASLLVLTIALLVPAPPGAAQPSPALGPPPAAESLTQALMALSASYQQAAPAEQARLLGELLRTAATRQQLLSGLVESDPGEVLRVALPADLRQSLPPAVQPLVDAGQAADVRGWYTIAQDSTVCDSSTTASLAKSAAQADGVNLSQYSRYVYAFPKNACTWWGLGTVGGKPSQAWINGSLQLRVVAHEMGHSFGLYHSRSLSCDTAGCTASEYGDGWDDMGGAVGHYNASRRSAWAG